MGNNILKILTIILQCANIKLVYPKLYHVKMFDF